AISAGIGDDADLERRQRAVLLGADLDMGRHLMARRGAGELLLAGEFPLHGPPELQQGQNAEILRHHLLLAAEAAADALGEDVEIACEEVELIAELLMHDEGSL